MGTELLPASLGVGGGSALPIGHWISSAVVPAASLARGRAIDATQIQLLYVWNGPWPPALKPDQAGQLDRSPQAHLALPQTPFPWLSMPPALIFGPVSLG